MGKFIDISGQRFGRWLVIKYVGNNKMGVATFLCKCECGAEGIVAGAKLRKGCSKSCGCYLHDKVRTHGKSNTSVYHTWRAMRQRCNNPNNKNYYRYGGRGIKVCKRWEKFENFYADMGDRPIDLTLERINNDGDYKPSNCKWATCNEQQLNTSYNRYLEYRGQKKTIGKWSEELKIPLSTLYDRLSKGWDGDKLFKTTIRR